jgi:hypothetical protein
MSFWKPKFTVFDIAKDLGLTVEYSRELPDNCAGLLEKSDEPRFIFVNANHPAFEQHFTIAHEIAHYLIHHNRPPRKYSNWFLDHQWRSTRLIQGSRFVRRMTSRTVNPELEADFWAICLFCKLGDIQTLKGYWHHHPERRFWICIALVSSAFNDLPHLPFLWLKILFRIDITP